MSERKMTVWPDGPVKFSWRERIRLYFCGLRGVRLPSGEKIYYFPRMMKFGGWCPETGKVIERTKIRQKGGMK